MLKVKVTALHAIGDTVGMYRKSFTHSQPWR